MSLPRWEPLSVLHVKPDTKVYGYRELENDQEDQTT